MKLIVSVIVDVDDEVEGQACLEQIEEQIVLEQPTQIEGRLSQSLPLSP